jgi:hypothetical protein
MSAANTPKPVAGKRVAIDAPRLWGGGLATAVVAALVAVVAVTAFVAALAATGLAHLLSVVTPRPRVFFGWIVALVTVATMVLPFALEGSVKGKVCAALINLVIGVCIASLLSAVLSRTVVDAERSWQQP